MNFRQTALAILFSIAATMASAQEASVTALVQTVPETQPTLTNIPVPPSSAPQVGSTIVAVPVPVAAAPSAPMDAIALAQQSAVGDPAYNRVIRSGILRCGYYVFAPLTVRDPRTNTLTGLSVEMTEALAATAGLKVEWTEEVDFGSWMTGLQTGRYDALCTPSWPDANLARVVSFTRPVFYSAINVYARGGDTRFDGNFNAINNPKVTIALIEGTPQVGLAQTYFPQARLLLLPQNSPGGAVAANVIAKKADLLFWDENGLYDYLRSNPGGLHNISPDHPIRVMPFELAVNQGEYRLRDLLDTGVQTLEDTGLTDQLLTRWERTPNSFYRVAKPYVVPAPPAAGNSDSANGIKIIK